MKLHVATDEQKLIDDVMNECLEYENDGGSKFPGMSYEQGVLAAVRWLTEDNESPMTD
jgi:hypothetical protein